MSKNLIPEVAKMLDIEIGKEFYVKSKHNCIYSKYRFTNERIEIFEKDVESWRDGSFVLPIIILGLCDITHDKEKYNG